MYTKNKILVPLILTLALGAVPGAAQSGQAFEFTGPHGMRITMLRQPQMEFIKAHLLIRYRNQGDPSLPFLTVINLFDPVKGGYRNSLLSTLYRMGNDFKVQFSYDHIIFKINFLPDHIEQFAGFLKTLYQFNFTNIEKFNFTKKHLFEIFKKDPHWPQKLATQIAYESIFKDHPLGNSFIFKNSLQNFNLVQIRSFFKRHFIPAHSLLVIKGDINPYVSWGIIKSKLTEIDVPDPAAPEEKDPSFAPVTRPDPVIIFPSNRPAPLLFTFIPGQYSSDFPLELITNELLFGKFTGMILRKQDDYNLRIQEIQNHLQKHRDHYVFCNSYTIEYPGIDNLLRLLSDLSRDYQYQNIELSRTDLLESIYFIKNYTIVQNADLETNLDNRLYDQFVSRFPSFDPDTYYSRPAFYINHLKNSSSRPTDGPRIHPFIVIFGDPERIFRHSPRLRNRARIVQENDYYID